LEINLFKSLISS